MQPCLLNPSAPKSSVWPASAGSLECRDHNDDDAIEFLQTTTWDAKDDGEQSMIREGKQVDRAAANGAAAAASAAMLPPTQSAVRAARSSAPTFAGGGGGEGGGGGGGGGGGAGMVNGTGEGPHVSPAANLAARESHGSAVFEPGGFGAMGEGGIDASAAESIASFPGTPAATLPQWHAAVDIANASVPSAKGGGGVAGDSAGMVNGSFEHVHMSPAVDYAARVSQALDQGNGPFDAAQMSAVADFAGRVSEESVALDPGIFNRTRRLVHTLTEIDLVEYVSQGSADLARGNVTSPLVVCGIILGAGLIFCCWLAAEVDLSSFFGDSSQLQHHGRRAPLPQNSNSFANRLPGGITTPQSLTTPHSLSSLRFAPAKPGGGSFGDLSEEEVPPPVSSSTPEEFRRSLVSQSRSKLHTADIGSTSESEALTVETLRHVNSLREKATSYHLCEELIIPKNRECMLNLPTLPTMEAGDFVQVENKLGTIIFRVSIRPLPTAGDQRLGSSLVLADAAGVAVFGLCSILESTRPEMLGRRTKTLMIHRDTGVAVGEVREGASSAVDGPYHYIAMMHAGWGFHCIGESSAFFRVLDMAKRRVLAIVDPLTDQTRGQAPPWTSTGTGGLPERTVTIGPDVDAGLIVLTILGIEWLRSMTEAGGDKSS